MTRKRGPCRDCVEGSCRCLLPEAAPAIHRGSIWLRPVPSQPGLWASDRGEIWSTRGKGWRKLKLRRNGCKPSDKRGGYLAVTVRDHNSPPPYRKITPSIHLLVAEAWHGPRPQEPWHECDHVDEDHLNNRPDNLEWIPAAENLAKRNRAKQDAGMGRDEDWEDVL